MTPSTGSAANSIVRELEPPTHVPSGVPRTVTVKGSRPALLLAMYDQVVGSSASPQPPASTPTALVMGLQRVSTRTSVIAFSKSTSKSVLPEPGRNWISITLVLGGNSEPSFG